MLQPFEDCHDQNQHHQVNAQMAHHSHPVYHESHQVNVPVYHSTNQALQNVSQIQQMTQCSSKFCISRKTIVTKAQTAIFRLCRNSIASSNYSIHQNECPSTDSNNNAQSQVNVKLIFVFKFHFYH